MESKLNLDFEGVVIGSHTLPEYKFQVCNFMNMLYKNINQPGMQTCMTVDVVVDNLAFEIIRLGDETSSTLSFDSLNMIGSIRSNVRKTIKGDITPLEKKLLINKSNQLWGKVLAELTKLYGLKYTINF